MEKIRIRHPGWKKIRTRGPGWKKFGSGINTRIRKTETYFKYMTRTGTYLTKWLYLDDRVKDLSEVLIGICVTGIDSAVLLTATPK
jgi:hypothetical protein